VVCDYGKLKEIIDAHKTLGHKIVCTVGSWDMLHIGHLRYLIKAKQEGDILVVGADSDRAIKLYKKNKLRPIIPEKERMEMLEYQDCVDYVTLVDDVDGDGAWKYGLLKKITPDVFVATTDSYPQKQINDIKKLVKKVIVLPRQGKSTSTSQIIERNIKTYIAEIKEIYKVKI
jgi:D-beta-D-heptose 7-phosphate kinase/D-beta-D-heptose 1-phosphate adenosyltransferase